MFVVGLQDRLPSNDDEKTVTKDKISNESEDAPDAKSPTNKDSNLYVWDDDVVIIVISSGFVVVFLICTYFEVETILMRMSCINCRE